MLLQVCCVSLFSYFIESVLSEEREEKKKHKKEKKQKKEKKEKREVLIDSALDETGEPSANVLDGLVPFIYFFRPNLKWSQMLMQFKLFRMQRY